jgi:hypothetical protein
MSLQIAAFSKFLILFTHLDGIIERFHWNSVFLYVFHSEITRFSTVAKQGGRNSFSIMKYDFIF